ncbi:DUF3823 domain-containing protein [Foetidibacter luteolus]|uniref:DUF3823 domain-containing protein n=1 Tax=Foetidibacter luteolus TaxID=2608880 RepID=UPI00129A652E|nr:DUF3823 domain-containing protein [Foetidibacter luteolus]
MKFKLKHIAVIALCAVAVSCKKDNYKEPTSKLSGRIVYQGEPIGVENYQVPYELYQYGFGKVGPIGSSFTQEGNFSAMLFDGEYKLIIPNGQGPFMWKKTAGGAPDSVSISLRGSQEIDLDVMPFYMIRTPQITGGSNKVTGTFKAEKIITGADAKDIENVVLYINRTQFVSGGDNIASAGRNGGDITDLNNITLTVDVPSITPAQNYVFARLSIKIAGVEDRIFSPVVKVTY